MNRRHFLRASLGLLAAPAIVRVASLMPMRAMPLGLNEYGVLTVNNLTRAEQIAALLVPGLRTIHVNYDEVVRWWARELGMPESVI